MKGDNRLEALLDGSLGYFAPLHNSQPEDLAEDDWIPGFIERVGNEARVQLLDEDDISWPPNRAPSAMVGATSNGGVILHNITRIGRNLTWGASKVSTRKFSASSVTLEPQAVDLTSTKLTEASVHIRRDAILAWAGLDPMKASTRLDRSSRVIGANIALRSTPTLSSRSERGVHLCFEGFWNLDHTQGEIVVDLALEVRAEATRSRVLDELLLPVRSVHELISIAFGELAPSSSGRCRHSGQDERAWLWDGRLMARGDVRVRSDGIPLFDLADLGGIDSVARWVRLNREHPRATAPLVRWIRYGTINPELHLLEVASAIEYWVASHRRSARWASKSRKNPNPPTAAARHLGPAFEDVFGDPRAWGKSVWDAYNDLKHNPHTAMSPARVQVLADSAQLVLLSLLLNRVSTTHAAGKATLRHHATTQLAARLSAL